MATILETLENLPIAQLSAHLDTAHGTLDFSASAALDPSDLLGELGRVMKTVKLPSDPAAIANSITSGLTQLESFAQLPELSLLADVAARLSALVSLIEEAAGHFGGDLTHLAESLLSGGGGIDDVLEQMVEQMLQTLPVGQLDDVGSMLGTIQSLVGHPLRSPDEVAAIIARFTAGVSLDDLRAPGRTLDAFLGRVRSAGGDLGGVETAINGLTTRVRATTSLMRRGEGIDWDAVLAEVEQVDAALDVLVSSTIPGALGRVTTDLAALDLGGLHGDLGQALKPLLDAIPHANFDLVETIGETIGQMFMAIAATTEEELTAKFQLLTDRLHESFGRSGVADATAEIDVLFDRLIGYVRGVPLRRLRHQLIDVLSDIEARIRSFPGFAAPTALTQEIAKISDAIDHLDTAAIGQKVQAVVEQLNGVVAQFPMQDIRSEVEGLLDQVTDVLGQVQPLFEQVNQQLDDLAAQAGEIDLSAAGQACIGLMHDIRTNVATVAGSGDLPEPAKAAIGAGAQMLKGLDLTIEIKQPFHAALERIDPTIVLAPVRPVMAKVQETLDRVTPAGLIAQLDGPFEKLQKELDTLRPANLLGSVTGELGRFMALVDKADPQALVAPLEAEFQKLLDTIRRALDPAPLFAPLRAAFARLMDLFKQLDIAKVLSAITDRLIDVPGSMGNAVKGALDSRGFGAGALPQVAAGDFKMGDFLRPVTHFIGQLRRQLTKLAHDLLAQAWALLREPLRALDEIVQPGLGLAGKLAREVDRRLASLDLFSPVGPAADLRQAIEDLITTRHSLHLDASVDGRLGPAVARLDLDTRADLLAAPRAAADVQRARFHGHAAPLDLEGALQAIGDLYADVFPASLRGDGPVDDIVALLNELLDKIDPTPLADTLDEVGGQAMAKLQTLFQTIVQGMFGLLNEGFGLLESFAPIGVFNRFNGNLARLAAELTVLDPAPIEAEARALVDAVVSVLGQYSPKHLAAMLSGVFDAIRSKLAAFDPATLLGDLSAIEDILAQFAELKPSVVLAPLVESTAGLTEMLHTIGSLELGDVVVQAVAKLKAQLEEIVAGIEGELQGLLDFLEGLAGGGSVSVSGSASVG